MQFPMKPAILAMMAAVFLFSCEKRTAKFRPGDKVKVKLTDTRGLVYARLSPFQDDLYYVKAAGKKSASNPWYFHWGSDEPNWHIEGPYYDSELQATQ